MGFVNRTKYGEVKQIVDRVAEIAVKPVRITRPEEGVASYASRD
jgi:hypothetical protein